MVLCKAVQAYVQFYSCFFIFELCLGVLHIISLHALSLHNSAHFLDLLFFAC